MSTDLNETIKTFSKVTSYEKEQGKEEAYNLYEMSIKYDYDIQNVINSFSEALKGDVDIDAEIEKAINKEVFGKDNQVNINFQSFGCTAFRYKDEVKNVVRMGRNYDFAINTSALRVFCDPKPVSDRKRYKSIAFAALSNIDANEAEKKKRETLVAPFICLDGVNEKGVSIAVLVVDSRPTTQYEDRKSIFTTLAIRLVLDCAATTSEAVDLLGKYNMFASGLKDYHFFINDANGDSKVVEYNYLKHRTRDMVVSDVDIVTNFYIFDGEKKGHGFERRNDVRDILKKSTLEANQKMWEALKVSAQNEKPNDPTSNTQWSIVYNNTYFAAEVAIRRNWNDKYRLC